MHVHHVSDTSVRLIPRVLDLACGLVHIYKFIFTNCDKRLSHSWTLNLHPKLKPSGHAIYSRSRTFLNLTLLSSRLCSRASPSRHALPCCPLPVATCYVYSP